MQNETNLNFARMAKPSPSDWGPSLWASLIYIASTYPSAPTIDVKNDYRHFFLNLGKVLPCPDCQKNYQKHLKVVPLDWYLDGHPSLLQWLLLIHNQVGEATNKPNLDMTQFLTKYLGPTLKSHNQQGGGCLSGLFGANGSWTQICWLILLAFVLGYFFYNRSPAFRNWLNQRVQLY